MSYLTKNVLNPRQGNEALYQLSCQTAEQLTADSSELSEFGIDQTEIDGYKNLSERFNARDFDEKFVLIQKSKTDTKNKAGIELMKTLFKLQTQMNVNSQNQKIDFSVFEIGAISNETELELLDKSKAIVNALTNSSVISISADLLSDLSEKVSSYEKALAQQRLAKYERKIATKLRQADAAELFEETRKFRELGKRMWLIKGDPVRSNAYLMPRDKGKPESEADVGESSPTETNPITNDYNTYSS